MRALIRLFVDLCLLKAGPQDVPASAFLSGLVLATYLVSGFIILFIQAPLVTALGHVALGTLVMVGFLQVLLNIRDLSARFQQTLAAVLGSGTVLNVLALPVTVWFVDSRMDNEVNASWIILFAMVLWSLVIFGHIIRHALGLALGAGILLGVLQLLLSEIVVNAAFPYTLVN